MPSILLCTWMRHVRWAEQSDDCDDRSSESTCPSWVCPKDPSPLAPLHNQACLASTRSWVWYLQKRSLLFLQSTSMHCTVLRRNGIGVEAWWVCSRLSCSYRYCSTSVRLVNFFTLVLTRHCHSLFLQEKPEGVENEAVEQVSQMSKTRTLCMREKTWTFWFQVLQVH